MKTCLQFVLPFLALSLHISSAIRTRSSLVSALADSEESDSDAQGVEALFQRVVFDVHGVYINEGRFQCGGFEYSFVKSLGKGFEGVTAILQRESGSGAGEKVVAKLTKEPSMKQQGHRKEVSPSAKTLQKECAVYTKMALAGIEHTLKCEAACEHGKVGSEHHMIILTPFVENAKPWTSTWIGGWMYEKDRRPFGRNSPIQITGSETEPQDPKVERALRLSFATVWDMLSIRVANTDQHHNVLYQEDGTPTFIDMGMAEDLNEPTILGKDFYVKGFLKAAFEWIPPLMLDWAEREVIPHKPLPPDVESIAIDYWDNWKSKNGKERADKEAAKQQKQFEDNCRMCIKAICDYSSFKERCKVCPACQDA